MRKCFYTVVLSDYDYEPIPPNFEGWETVIISDKMPNKPDRWSRWISVTPCERPDILSRYFKWLSHRYLSEYDLVCYFDANMEIIKEIEPLPFRIRHWKRNSVQEEIDACNRQLHRVTPESLQLEMDYFKKQGFKDDVGLWINGFFARKHTKEENALCELIYKIICTYTSRDQVAMPFAMWKKGYRPQYINDYKFFSEHIKMNKHKNLSPVIYGIDGPVKNTRPAVHHITPARTDKDFGKAINTIVANVSEGDWICLRDIDTLPLDHISFIKQCEEIAAAGRFDLVSCLTNRLGMPHQLLHGKLSLNSDINEEVYLAKHQAAQHGSEVLPTELTVAGVMMLFSKEIWKKAGGFKEGGIRINNSMIDWHFSTDVKNAGGKIGIAHGIYLFHLYRWGKPDVRNTAHLL